ncbi:MAG: hypothetical protein KJ696_04335 [Gammaproteobacteria bacterium]|nr:hypothetical protein [Gammaproteobacteria bacterium]
MENRVYAKKAQDLGDLVLIELLLLRKYHLPSKDEVVDYITYRSLKAGKDDLGCLIRSLPLRVQHDLLESDTDIVRFLKEQSLVDDESADVLELKIGTLPVRPGREYALPSSADFYYRALDNPSYTPIGLRATIGLEVMDDTIQPLDSETLDIDDSRQRTNIINYIQRAVDKVRRTFDQHVDEIEDVSLLVLHKHAFASVAAINKYAFIVDGFPIYTRKGTIPENPNLN